MRTRSCMCAVHTTKRLWNARRGVLKGARRDSGQIRFVEKCIVIAGEINDSICRCTRLSVAGERCKSRFNYQNITTGF